MGNARPIDDFEEPSFQDELQPGSELMHGQYRIESFLNAGGFGITYSARDSLDRRVVIKECFPSAFCRRSRALVQARSRAHKSELSSIVRLFVQEARSLAKLNHPNIVGVHQVFEENNTAYMALDFVQGRDLLEIIEDEQEDISPDDLENILRKVLDAVGFIHQKGILHRDISPDNILVDTYGEPVLIDFGAAREEATKQSRVLSALRVVKDGYSPQEFYISGSEQGPYSDLYALGASFYHAITGDLPPNSQARLSAVAMGDADPYEPVAGRFTGYKSTMLQSIDRAMEILPKDRIASASDWLAMIDGTLQVAVEASAKADGKKMQAAPVAAAAPKSAVKPVRVMLLASVAGLAIAAGIFVSTQGGLFEGLDVAGAAQPGTEPVVAAPVQAEPEAAVETEAADAGATSGFAPLSGEIVQEPRLGDLSAIVSAFDLALASEDAPVGTSGTASQELPDFGPDDALSLPGNLAGGDVAERRAVIDNLPKPEIDAQGPQIDMPAAFGEAPARSETVDDTPVPQDGDSPVDFFQRIIEMTDAPNSDILAAFDNSVPPAAVAAPVETAQVSTSPVPGVTHRWTVLLPLRGLFDLGSTRIFEVNGEPVGSREAFDDVVGRTEAISEAATVTLSVKMGASLETAEIQDWTLPVAQSIMLANGWAFEAAIENDGWVTRVVEKPAGNGTDVDVGDIVYGYIPTAERVDQRTSLIDIFTREAAAGNTVYSFAFKRGDEAWASVLQFDSTRFEN